MAPVYDSPPPLQERCVCCRILFHLLLPPPSNVSETMILLMEEGRTLASSRRLTKARLPENGCPWCLEREEGGIGSLKSQEWGDPLGLWCLSHLTDDGCAIFFCYCCLNNKVPKTGQFYKEKSLLSSQFWEFHRGLSESPQVAKAYCVRQGLHISGPFCPPAAVFEPGCHHVPR